MKQITLTRLFGVAVAGLLAGEFTPSVRADADDKPAAKAAGDAAAESPVKRNANGEMVVTIAAATQERIKLEFAHPVAAEWQPVVNGYGRVIDPAPLAAAVAELATARLTAGASAREYERLDVALP